MYRSPFFLFGIACLVGGAQAQQINFGLSAAVGDHEVFVGKPNNTGSPGTVLAFRATGDGETWEMVAEIAASDGTPQNGFGLSMAVEGSVLAVGAPSVDSGQGAVYVFERQAEDGTWAETARLTAADADSMSTLGYSISVNGSTVVAGAIRASGDAGAAYVFGKVDGAWTEVGRLAASDGQGGDFFGAAVLARHGRIYVGAPGQGGGQGSVYVFDAETLAESASVQGPEDEDSKALGSSLAAPSETSLVAGSPGISPAGPGAQPGPPPAGAIFGFELDDEGAWTHGFTARPDSSRPMDMFGFKIAHGGGRLFVASPGADGFVGAVYTYESDAESGTWAQAGIVQEGDGQQLFGFAMAVAGDRAVASAPGANFGQGVVHTFAADPETGELASAGRIFLTPIVTLTASGPADCSDGVAGQFDCMEVDMLSFLPIDAVGGEGAQLNDIWGWTDPETGREWALVGRTNGTAFVDVTDPSNPFYAGSLPLTEGANPSSWRDIKVHADHAFIVADNAGNHGMQVFDLRHLRNAAGDSVEYEQTAHYDKFASAHNIVVNEDTGFAFAVGSSGGGETCGGGLHMIDVREPANPTFAGCFAHTETGMRGTGYSHDAQCVLYHGPDPEYQGREICFGANETALSIADISDKENPIAVSQAAYPNVAYAHQGWLTDDHAYFYMNDELDELQGKIVGTRTMIWDVTDLDDPELVKEQLSENKASDHNLYIRGNLMYQSNYLSGLRILDISDLDNPVEVGFFDTVPGGDDTPGFGGSWSNYPFFESGTIIVTSMGEGLFVLKKRGIDT